MTGIRSKPYSSPASTRGFFLPQCRGNLWAWDSLGSCRFFLKLSVKPRFETGLFLWGG